MLNESYRQHRGRKLGDGTDTSQTENIVNRQGPKLEEQRGKQLQVLAIKEVE